MTARALLFCLFSFPFSLFAFAQPLPDRKPLVGLALDSAGKPLAGAVVSIRRQEDAGAFAFWGASVASDARGEFRFERAEVGRYYLNAEIAGFAPIYNQSVIWKGDEKNNRPLRLQFQRLVNFRPQILKSDGTPAANLVVWLRLRGDGSAGQTSRRAQTDGNGNVAVDGLLSANYALFVASNQGFSLETRLELRSNLAPEIRLQKGGTLRAVVRAKEGALLGGAILSLVPENTAEIVRLGGENADPSDDYALLGAMGERITLVSRDGDGVIEIPNLPAGRYSAKIALSGYQNAPARSTTIRAGEVAELGFDLTPKSGARASLNLQLRAGDDAAQTALAGTQWLLRFLPINANGTLATDQTPDDAPFTPEGQPGRRVVADGEGKLQLFPLPTGRFRVFAARRSENGSEKAGESASLDLELKAGENAAQLQLKR